MPTKRVPPKPQAAASSPIGNALLLGLAICYGLGTLFARGRLEWPPTQLLASAYTVAGCLALVGPILLHRREGGDVGLGVAFGASSITRDVVGDYMVNVDAGRFASKYVEVLKNDPIAMSFWYQQNPDYRNEHPPDVVFDEMKKAAGPTQAQVFNDKVAAIQKIKDRLANKGETVRFVKIESKAADGLTQYANALLEFDGPGSPGVPEKEQFGMLQMVKIKGQSSTDWVIKEVLFPYKPASAAVELPHKADDGHGH